MKLIKKLLVIGVATLSFSLIGCEKEPVKIVSVSIHTDADRGSGNFNRMLEICFDKPLKSNYYHTMHLKTKDGFKLSGGSWLRPRASDPRNKCQERNLYVYLGRNDPPGSRQFIDEHVIPGNIEQLMIRIYDDEPDNDRTRPMAERIFSNI